METIYRCFQENLSSTLTVTHPNTKIQQQARSHLQPRWSIFSSTGARYLKEFMRQYSPPYKLTPNDWRTFLWFLKSKPILDKTVSRYTMQARLLLDFFTIPHLLHPGGLTSIGITRVRRTKPRREYCVLTWENVRKIRTKSRTDSHN